MLNYEDVAQHLGKQHVIEAKAGTGMLEFGNT